MDMPDIGAAIRGGLLQQDRLLKLDTPWAPTHLPYSARSADRG